jgi:hypothetical protein
MRASIPDQTIFPVLFNIYIFDGDINIYQNEQSYVNAIKLIRKFFNSTKLLQLLTSNFYPVLNYNSEVWQVKTPKYRIKNQLLSASANAVRIALHYPAANISFLELHEGVKWSTPKMFSKYKLSIYSNTKLLMMNYQNMNG